MLIYCHPEHPESKTKTETLNTISNSTIACGNSDYWVNSISCVWGRGTQSINEHCNNLHQYIEEVFKLKFLILRPNNLTCTHTAYATIIILSLYEVKKEDRTLPIFTPGSTRTSKVNKYRQKFCFLIEREILKCTTHKKPVLFFNSPFKNCTLNSYKSATELKVGLSLTCQIKHCAADTFPGSAGSYPCHSWCHSHRCMQCQQWAGTDLSRLTWLLSSQLRCGRGKKWFVLHKD